MDMHMMLIGNRSGVLSSSWQLFFSFTVIPARWPPVMVDMTFSTLI
jgi:hypothetical protein